MTGEHEFIPPPCRCPHCKANEAALEASEFGVTGEEWKPRTVECHRVTLHTKPVNIGSIFTAPEQYRMAWYRCHECGCTWQFRLDEAGRRWVVATGIAADPNF